MRLAIDAREAFSAQKAGKGQWTYGFLQELRTRSVEVIVLSDSEQDDVVALRAGPRWHIDAAKYVFEQDIDCYISPTSYITPWLLKGKVPFIPIVHDMIAFRDEPHDWKATTLERFFLPKILPKALHICTVSEATKQDLLEKYSELEFDSVTSIFAGPMSPEVPLSQPDGKTILCVGTLCPRKNQQQLIAAYASLPDHLRSKYRLLLVGARGWQDDAIIRHAQNTKGVEWLDYVSDKEYQTLLLTATVFAYPSLYEGFGMQALDALQRGIPLLTSNRGSLAEVAGDAALVVDPDDERSIASGLVALLESKDLRDSLHKKGPEQAKHYSWKQTVDIFLDAIENHV